MPDDERNISRNVAHLNILVHDVINLLYYHTKEYSNTFDPTTIFLQREKGGLNIKEPEELMRLKLKEQENYSYS